MRDLKIPKGEPERDDNVAYGGGLDLVTPEMKKKPSVAISVNNWDIPATGGYRTHPGYERYDGHPRPSSASVTQLEAITTFDVSVAVGDTITGNTTATTGQVIYIDPARKWIALTKVAGAGFSTTEIYKKGAATVATGEAFSQTISADLGNQIVALAAAVYRLDIAVPTGSGGILGVVIFNDLVYAWRNNAGGTAAVCFKETAAGWSAIALQEEISFTAGNSSVNEGDVLTQGGVTATISRVAIISGTSPALVGKLTINSRAGGNFAAGAATSTGGGALTLTAVQTAQTWAASGKFGFRVHNFGGASPTKRCYGWNGVGRAFEFDGTNFVFIDTGMVPDAPAYGEIHLNILWLAFKSSVQKSGPGNPYAWSAVLSAAEFAAGADVTGLLRTPGSTAAGALQVFTADYTKVIYGDQASTFRMDTVLQDVGALPFTATNLAITLFLDDLGITSMVTAQEFGNFEGQELSMLVKPLLGPKVTSVTCATVIRDNGQFKVFFSDGSGLTATFFGKKLIGIMPFTLNAIANVQFEGSKSGVQMVLIGGTDGMVYELNRGRSFDGQPINVNLRLADNFIGNPRMRKKYKRLRVDVQSSGYNTMSIGYIAGRNDPEIDSAGGTQVASSIGGGIGFDDPAGGFDVISFDADLYTFLAVGLDVTATSISFVFTNSSDNQLPMTITGQTLAWIPRRVQRQ